MCSMTTRTGLHIIEYNYARLTDKRKRNKCKIYLRALSWKHYLNLVLKKLSYNKFSESFYDIITLNQNILNSAQ